MHDVITDNCKKIKPEYQLLNSTVMYEGFKDCSYHKNTMSELKAVLEVTSTRPNTSWKTTTPLTHSCSNDDVTQLGPLGSDSDAMFEVIEISDACFVHLLLQYAVVNRI